MRTWLLLALLVTVVPAWADWHFSPYVAVTGAPKAGVFQHLESAGRRNLAIATHTVALVWEDNHSGAPQVYIAFKPRAGKNFSAARRISTGKEAYEPVIAALANDRFVLAWEQDGHVWMALADAKHTSTPRRVDSVPSSQATLASDGRARAYLAWAHRDGHFMRVMVARTDIKRAQVHLSGMQAADVAPPQGAQAYPALAVVPAGVVAAWEDRRQGHTRLFVTRAADGAAFVAPKPLNTLLPGRRSAKFGRGTGVTRVALAQAGDQVAATWMDKRNFHGGYDIYAAISADGGRRFGANELVQDAFGDNVPQWHPSVAVAPSGQVVVAWDDPRDDSPDVWLSWRKAHAWSDDLAVPPASGAGAQLSPVIVVDDQGRLHMAWIQRSGNGATQIRYVEAAWSGRSKQR